ncbi:hypothetical protein MMC10_004393 [Thelotrema lepadinum]|nr:hypothetical protein [Thelotrema lepadinum]
MKLEEVFEFDANAYAASAVQKNIKELRQQEIVKTRQIIKSDTSAVTDAITAVATGGATVLKPIYSARSSEVATAKLKIIQAELTRRRVPLHQPDEADQNAAALGIIAGEVGGDVFDGAMPDTVSEAALGPVLGGMAVEEGADGVAAEYSDKLPPNRCSRASLKKHHRLRCDGCGWFFDSSFADYLRE